MNAFSKDIQHCIAALGAIDLINDSYASTLKGGDLVKEVADMLAFRPSEMGRYGGLRKQISDAIYRGVLNCEPPHQSGT